MALAGAETKGDDGKEENVNAGEKPNSLRDQPYSLLGPPGNGAKSPRKGGH